MIPGAGWRQTHYHTVLSILGSREMVPVRSMGSQFYNKNFWPLRFLVKEMCDWAKANPNKTPDKRVIRDWVKKVNGEKRVEPEIVIAATENWLTRRAAMALVGGGYHEAFHTVYSRRVELVASEVSKLILPLWGQISDWSPYAGLLLEMSNIIEDIRIERMGRVEFPGIDVKMHDLQDFILGKEFEGHQKDLQQNSKFRMGTLRVAKFLFRDIGLGYHTEKQRMMLDLYEDQRPDACKMVLEGPLSDILRKSIPDTSTPQKLEEAKRDVDASLRLAMEFVIVIDDLVNRFNLKIPEHPGCPKCGASASNLTIRPKGRKDNKNIIEIECDACGWKEEQEMEDKENPDDLDMPEVEYEGEQPKMESQCQSGGGGGEGDSEENDSEEGDSEENDSDGGDSEEGEEGEGSGESKSKSKPQRSKNGKPESKGDKSKSESGSDEDEDKEEGAGGSDSDSEGDEEDDSEGAGKGSDSDSEEGDDSEGDSEGDSEDGFKDGDSKSDSGKDDSEEGDDSKSGDDSTDGDSGDGSEDGDSKGDESGDGSEGDQKGDQKGSQDGDQSGDVNLEGGDEGYGQDAKEGPADNKTEQTHVGETGAGGYQYTDNKDAQVDFDFTAAEMREELESGKDKALLDYASALSEELDTEKEKVEARLRQGERTYSPWTTDFDQVELVRPSSHGRGADAAAADRLEKSVKRESSYLRARMRNMFRALEQRGVEHGIRRGRLLSGRMLADTVAAVRGRQIPKRAFMRRDEEMDTSIAASVVIDESSSMTSLLRDATRIMIAITEPLDHIGAKVMVSGFRDGSGYFRHHPEYYDWHRFHRHSPIRYDVFKTFDERYATVKWRFSRTVASGGTPMADGIQFGLDALSIRSEGHRFMFVITDGQPNGDHHQVINYQIRLAKEAGIHLIGVGLGRYASYVKALFPDYVHSNRIDEIPYLLVAKLNQLVDRAVRNRGRRMRDTRR